ncbi:MAG: F0F1 ATP synthase subunit epsilon [Betaproteobacteria bacterium]|nr:F0F1 ATP synthase subunit epsilon [Betaproteobacteria bacterium]
MAMTVHVDIVSPEECLFSGLARFLIVPAEMGEVGIFPHHAPMITRIRPGTVRIDRVHPDPDEFIFISGGILEVQPQCVTILSDTAVRAKDLDEKAAIEARRKAEEAVKDRVSAADFAKLQAEISKALAEIQTVRAAHHG